MFRLLILCCLTAACVSALPQIAQAMPQVTEDRSSTGGQAPIEKGVNLNALLPPSPATQPAEPRSLTQPVLLLAGYSLLIVMASLLGGWLMGS